MGVINVLTAFKARGMDGSTLRTEKNLELEIRRTTKKERAEGRKMK